MRYIYTKENYSATRNDELTFLIALEMELEVSPGNEID